MSETSPSTAPDDLVDRLAHTPIYGVLGVRLLELTPDVARLELPCVAVHGNLDGVVHGGILGLLADTAMGLVARMQMEPGGANATLQMAISFPAAGRVGDLLLCEGRVSSQSGRFVWTVCDIRSGERLVAQATGLQLRRPAPAGGQEDRPTQEL